MSKACAQQKFFICRHTRGVLHTHFENMQKSTYAHTKTHTYGASPIISGAYTRAPTPKKKYFFSFSNIHGKRFNSIRCLLKKSLFVYFSKKKRSVADALWFVINMVYPGKSIRKCVILKKKIHLLLSSENLMDINLFCNIITSRNRSQVKNDEFLSGVSG